MTDAKVDRNQIPVLTAASNADGKTPILVDVDPTIHGINVSDGTTGSDFPRTTDPRDNNGIPVAMGVSSADGVTPVPIYATPTGELLIKST